MADDLIPLDGAMPRPAETGFDLGQWYWVKRSRKRGDDDEPKKWLGCVMHVGSNYVLMRSPPVEGNYFATRVHFDDAPKVLTAEPNAAAIIQSNVDKHQANVVDLLGQVRELTMRLGIVDTTALPAPSTQSGGNALAVLSGAPDVGKYKRDLVKAKDKDLPALFEKIKEQTKEVQGWMTASTLPMEAQVKRLKMSVGEIDNRIFNVSLYAGLTEEVTKAADGAPADMLEKLRVLQRRLYMDEECLLNYEAGGMEFKSLKAFDAWIARPVNRDRILPFPRCIVSMRVRRHRKEREDFGDPLTTYINFNLEKADKLTFLYIRNGEQVWRLSCEQDFGEQLFADQSDFEARPMMIKADYYHAGEEMMTRSKFEHESVEAAKKEVLAAAWEKANKLKPKKDREHFNPHERHNDFDPKDWKPLDPATVYYDDGMQMIRKDINAYNRIVLIIQGLLDRSDTLVPHPPINLWRAEHVERHIELIFDAGTTLTAGEKPDFEAYRRRLNGKIYAKSYLVGQRDFWMQVEAERENERQRKDWRRKHHDHYKRYKPYGNPGPQMVERPNTWSARAGRATFRWMRDAVRYSRDGGKIAAVITVPVVRLFNVSAYTPGDYLQFFKDHRTRQEYMKWAPFLLAAEDFHAAKLRKPDHYGDNVSGRW